MAGPLETVVRQMFTAFDSKNFRDAMRMFADDAQAVDEMTRKWIRGHKGIADYLAQLEPVIDDIRTEVEDVHEKVWDAVGLVTCWIEQDYTLEGKAQHVSSPTTVLLRRESSAWRIALVHAVALPDTPAL
jgi:ketosteroid isomerase-like protein